MSDKPTYRTYVFTIELNLPSTDECPVDPEMVKEALKDLIEDDPDFESAKSIKVTHQKEKPN